MVLYHLSDSIGRMPACRNGRRGRLKICCGQPRAGSSPAAGISNPVHEGERDLNLLLQKGASQMKKLKVLFQGDSITDAFRDYSDYHDLGTGYPKYAAACLKEKYQDIDFEFINLGISGNQTKDLVERLQKDFIDIQPDIVSILIGVNDVWHYAENREWLSHDLFEERYRTVLEALKEKTNAKIFMLEPFLIPVEDKLYFREDLAVKIEIIRKLAREYADLYLPTDGLLQSAFIGDDPLSYAADGVHPTDKGAEYIGSLYAEWIAKLIEIEE